MLGPFSPDRLDELDRRVYELAVLPIPLAEIAVRLGVPTARAAERLERPYSRAGVSDRDALRALAEVLVASPPGDPADEYVIGAGLDEPATLGSARPPRFNRRGLLKAGAVLTAAGLAGVAGLAWAGRGGRRQSPGDATPTQTALADGAASPLAPVAVAGETFITQDWASGEAITWLHGIFAMDSASGKISGYQFKSAGNFEWSRYRMLGDGRLFTADNDTTGEGIVADRLHPERAWSWTLGDLRLVAASAPPSGGTPVSLLFVSSAGSSGRTLRFVSAGAETVEAGQASLPPAEAEEQFLSEPSGNRVAVFDGASQAPSIRIFHARSGTELAKVAVRDILTANEPAITARSLTPCSGGFVAHWQTATNGRGELPVAYFSRVVAWDGRPLTNVRQERFGTVYARDYEQAVIEEGDGRILPEGFPWGWRSVEFSRTFSEPVAFRLRSASILYGDDLPPNRWLADGSGFVAAVRGPSARRYRYAIVPVDGSPIVPLPAPPGVDREVWYDDSWVCGPVPCPATPALFSFGRLHLYNRATGKWFSARLQGASGPDHLDPWSGFPAEMVFALPHPGHGTPTGPVLLAPRFESPPFDNSPRLVVEVDATGLNLRREPSLQSESIALLHDGEGLTLTEADPALGRGEVSTLVDGQVAWLHVRTESGLEGWVNSTWIAWA